MESAPSLASRLRSAAAAIRSPSLRKNPAMTAEELQMHAQARHLSKPQPGKVEFRRFRDESA